MFLCLLSLDGSPVSDVERTRYASRMRALAAATAVQSEEIQGIDAQDWVGFVAPALVPLRPLYSRRRGLVAVGNVRLDHRDDVRRVSGTQDANASDLDLMLEAVEAGGTGCIPDMLGDFAAVIWDQRTRTLVVARDAFGVKTLFMRQSEQLLVVSSHLELVHDDDALDEEYVASFLIAADPGPTRTIWADSKAVAPGTVLTVQSGKTATDRFWDPHAIEQDATLDEASTIEEFRTLFREAVRTRLEPGRHTWSELSGGLDSSSIVSMAQTLYQEGAIPRGLAGTITFVDELGTGNEQRFSDAVVQAFGLPNHIVWNPCPWQDDELGPPRTDEPRTHYPFFARDRMICNTVRNAGAQVLLSGMGSDHYLFGNRLFISDLLARGQISQSLVETTRWTIANKQSFWTSYAKHAIMPLLPASVQLRFIDPWLKVPDWIEPAFARRLKMTERLPVLASARVPAGVKYARRITDNIQELPRWLPRGPFEEGIELRYPFLYRPLVELGLRLPQTLRARPQAPKWILREAMRGVLPEIIRTRPGKGGIDARLLWGFQRERPRLSKMLTKSALAPQGILRTPKLEATLDQAVKGESYSVIMLLATLSLETWLAARIQPSKRAQAPHAKMMALHHTQDALSA